MEVLKDSRAIAPLDFSKSNGSELDAKLAEMDAMMSNASLFGEISLLADGVTRVAVSVPTEKEPFSKLRAESVIDAEPEAVLALFMDPKKYVELKLDPACIANRMVEEKDLSGGGKLYVRYGEWTLGWPLWNRDFLMLCRTGKRADGSVYVISQSLQDHPKVPLRVTEVQRAILLGDYLVCSPLDGGKRTSVTLCTSADPMGYIPTAVINFLIKQNAGSLAVAQKVLGGHKK